MLLRSTLDQVLRAGFFHADPHPGNVFAFPDGTLGLIDFGAVGRLDSIQQAAVVDMLAALARHDVSLLRDGIERVADVTGAGSPEQLERALARLLADHIRATGAVDPAILQDLVAMLTQFGVRLPGDLVILSRALVTLDGTLRVLAPGMSLVAAATEMITATSDDADPRPRRDGAGRARGGPSPPAPAPRSHRPHPDPRRARRPAGAERRRRGRPPHPADAREPGAARGRRRGVPARVRGPARRRPTTAPRSPPDTGLFEVFGYGGLVVGAVLLLRVVAAVARDGTT